MCVKRSRGSLSGLNLSASTSARQLTSAGLRCQFLSRKPRSNLYVGVIPSNSCGGTPPSLAPEVCRVPSRWLCRLWWPWLRDSGSPAPSLVELLGHIERCVGETWHQARPSTGVDCFDVLQRGKLHPSLVSQLCAACTQRGAHRTNNGISRTTCNNIIWDSVLECQIVRERVGLGFVIYYDALSRNPLKKSG